MNISVYGAGYVGLVSAVCFAKMGHNVLCADINKQRIEGLIKGKCPIYEEQLPELLVEQLATGRLKFTASLSSAIQQSTIHFIATGTPGLPDGRADLSQVFAVAVQIAKEVERDAVIVTKSTVPVGTGNQIDDLIAREMANREKTYKIDVLSNPEFLREGTAVNDFFKADRIVIGGDASALNALKSVYQPLFSQGIPLVSMSRLSAELTKYSANAMLACKVSFINHISRIAEKVGADIDEVTSGMALDKRIGPQFLRAGIGYGGACFPKDSRALIQTAHSLGMASPLLEAVETINDLQKNWVIEKIKSHFNNDIQGRQFAVWGLSFKPGTDDLREASSLVTLHALLAAGAKVKLFDPAAMPEARKNLPETAAITWCDSPEACVNDSMDGLIIATEWSVFTQFSLKKLAHYLEGAPVFDGRNCYQLSEVQVAGLTYYSVGRPSVNIHSI